MVIHTTLLAIRGEEKVVIRSHCVFKKIQIKWKIDFVENFFSPSSHVRERESFLFLLLQNEKEEMEMNEIYSNLRQWKHLSRFCLMTSACRWEIWKLNTVQMTDGLSWGAGRRRARRLHGGDDNEHMEEVCAQSPTREAGWQIQGDLHSMKAQL